MVSIEFTEEEIELLWFSVVEQICKELMAIQNSKTEKDLFLHKHRKFLCDDLADKIKVLYNK